MSPEERVQKLINESPTLSERLDKRPILIGDFVEKLDRFTELWKEGMISDGEYVGAIKQLTFRVIVIDGNYIQS